MFPKNQKIEPKAPEGHYFWVRLDDNDADPMQLGWWLELRRQRRFWFDKIVLRTYLCDYNQSDQVTPGYMNLHAKRLVDEFRKEQLRRDLARNFGDYVQ